MVIRGWSCSVRVPSFPFTVTRFPFATVTVTPAGISTGILPILDISITSPSDYHTNARTSPPTFSARAFLPVMIPLDVDTIAMPSPFITLGISSQPA